ncbi:MAG: M28 family peptidase [Enhygromyxa sp.]
MRRRSLALLVSLLLPLGFACRAETPAPVEPERVAIDIPQPPASPELAVAPIVATVEFLADDAQLGRAPGTEADARVQAWIAERMAAAGLEPYLDESFLQRFEVGDGVRLREGEQSRLVGPSGEAIAHAILPFGHDTGEAPVKAKLVFVGHGIPGEGDDPGDFAAAKLDGAIAVALVGSADPHVAPVKARPQSKLIAARDRGALGLVLWDPSSDAPPPNHGQYSELGIPAVFVGTAGSEDLRKALRLRGEAMPKPGDRSRVELELATPIEPVVLTTANVVGLLPGSAAVPERKRIIIGAHMDHLGLGTATSLAPGEQAVHNGADDNASGVAVLLALAEVFASVAAEHRPHDLLFVAFGAEEMGLLGSKHMIETMAEAERARVLAMLNFDMVGRLRDSLIVNGTGTAEEWPELLETANGEPRLQLEAVPDGWGPSDHASFYGEGVPVLHFFTGSHEDYHKPSDDLDKLNGAGAAAVGELAARVTLALMERCEPLTFVKVERPTQTRAAFRVSLGTMPDYGKTVDGLALAGVSEGGAAAAAGLQKGDVITKIGAREIHNIDDYMACFAELEPGVEVELEFEREGQRATTKLVPAAPRQH